MAKIRLIPERRQICPRLFYGHFAFIQEEAGTASFIRRTFLEIVLPFLPFLYIKGHHGLEYFFRTFLRIRNIPTYLFRILFSEYSSFHRTIVPIKKSPVSYPAFKSAHKQEEERVPPLDLCSALCFFEKYPSSLRSRTQEILQSSLLCGSFRTQILQKWCNIILSVSFLLGIFLSSFVSRPKSPCGASFSRKQSQYPSFPFSLPSPIRNLAVQYSLLSIFCRLFLLIFGDCTLLRFFLILHRF